MKMEERPGCCPALIGAIVQGEYCVAKLPNPDHWLRRNWKKKTWFLINPFHNFWCHAASYPTTSYPTVSFSILQHPTASYPPSPKTLLQGLWSKAEIETESISKARSGRLWSKHPLHSQYVRLWLFWPQPSSCFAAFLCQSLSPAPGHCQTSPMHLCICD